MQRMATWPLPSRPDAAPGDVGVRVNHAPSAVLGNVVNSQTQLAFRGGVVERQLKQGRRQFMSQTTFALIGFPANLGPRPSPGRPLPLTVALPARSS